MSVTDDTGCLEVVAIGKVAERIMQTTPEHINELKKIGETYDLNSIKTDFENKMFLMLLHQSTGKRSGIQRQPLLVAYYDKGSHNTLSPLKRQMNQMAISPGGGDGGGGVGSGGGGGGGGEGGGNFKKLLAWYLCMLEKYPVRTKAATSALLNLIGDLVCQLVIDKTPSLDLKRIARFSLLGFCLVGPTLHFWYLYLSKLVTVPGASGAAMRLVLDQFVFAPMFIGVFFTALMTLEGKPLQVIPKLQQEWFSSVIANWQLWIPFQFLNFRFVPQQLQVLASNFVALAWNVFLSYKAHKEVQPK
ncbi:transporter [Lithospermum erythrorhizon]|uniref:Transporter n=1 Tax=Lithospermum erythrorhizon TaxID=34254 RepID=A0AAV3NHU0_LITER